MTPSPFGIHQWLSGQFAYQIIQQLKEQDCTDCYLIQEVDWIIEEDMVVRPDLSVVCGELPERFIEQVPVLVIEILSESTQDRDTHAKRALYAAHGVKYYATVDPWRWECDLMVLKRRKYSDIPGGDPIELDAGCRLRFDMPRKPPSKS